MDRIPTVYTRRKLSKISKVLQLLQKGPKTKAQLVDCFRECKFDGYSWWISEELKGAISSLKRKGLIERVTSGLKGKPYYRLVKGEVNA